MAKKQTTIFYDELEADFDVVFQYISEEFEVVNNFSSQLPLPLKLSMNVSKRGDKGSVGMAADAAIKCLWKRREYISPEIWTTLGDNYENMPRAEKIDVGGGQKEWRNIGRTSVHLEPDSLDLITDIALYMRSKNYMVTRMLRGGEGSPKVIVSIAVMYCSRHYIPQLRKTT